jgi:hypothetical protein
MKLEAMNRSKKTGRKSGTLKTGGRKKGTPNKITGDLRSWVNDVLNDNREQVIQDLRCVEPDKRLMFFEKLLNYAIPKMQQSDLKLGVGDHTVIKVGFLDDDD